MLLSDFDLTDFLLLLILSTFVFSFLLLLSPSPFLFFLFSALAHPAKILNEGIITILAANSLYTIQLSFIPLR